MENHTQTPNQVLGFLCDVAKEQTKAATNNNNRKKKKGKEVNNIAQ